MASIVDTRGKPCPQPVILTRKVLLKFQAATTIVDNEISRHNVTRMAKKNGFTVRAEEREDGIYLHIHARKDPASSSIKKIPDPAQTVSPGDTVLSVQDEFMGSGDKDLGRILIRGFFHTLAESIDDPSLIPDKIVFYNVGVKLVSEDSPILSDLKMLEDQGVDILSCGICIGHFGLKDRIGVGIISNMYDIAEILLSAGKVINL
ncbi:MAG: hypothetical protein B6244_01430 [Candidatus Cloacimonetes bacterium 4572_55]|nr:MAG: hypothetical protein B6244_01430 [Candidatus Cloacimonetes bacterium 4572_55]